MRRARGIAVAGVLASLVLALSGSPAQAGPKDDRAAIPGRFDLVYPGFAPAQTTLSQQRPARLRLDPAPIEAAWAQLDGFANPADPAVKPMYSSMAAVIGHQGRIVGQHAGGYSLQYADGEGTKLPESERIRGAQDTIYDMASVTKLFTSIMIMQLVEQDQIELDEPYATYVPEFGNNGKESITVRQMLTHTSGLVPFLPLWRDHPDEASRIQAVMEATPANPPGTAYTYSDLNLIALGVLAGRISGTPLDQLLQERIAGPLKMVDTGFNPPASKLRRIAATEYQEKPARGIVWGQVHDENAWSLGGVAGHAGVFSTTSDMAILAQTMLNGGVYDGARILSSGSVEAMITDENTEFPGDAHGLGFELNQLWYMGGLGSGRTAGHTGYTGTSLVIDYQSRSFAVLLTNRVHPSRSWGSNNPARRAVAGGLAQALAVQPREGPTAWSGGAEDASEHTLALPLPERPAGSTLRFDTFADHEFTDVFALETSNDDGETWSLSPYTVTVEGAGRENTDGTWNNQGNRTWGSAEAVLPDDAQLVRWRYTTDSNTRGRGVFVDDVRIKAGAQVLFDGEAQPDAFAAQEFVQVAR